MKVILKDKSILNRVHGFNNEKIVIISCGLWYSMALTESGRVYSWGNNSSGQLGQNIISSSAGKPSDVLISDNISTQKIRGLVQNPNNHNPCRSKSQHQNPNRYKIPTSYNPNKLLS
jgi:alpha-tubulin suppressor-like RCC1 family protein